MQLQLGSGTIDIFSIVQPAKREVAKLSVAVAIRGLLEGVNKAFRLFAIMKNARQIHVQRVCLVSVEMGLCRYQRSGRTTFDATKKKVAQF